jgi:hypothetical protein
VAGGVWLFASVLFAFEPAAGTVTPAAGAGGEIWTAGVAVFVVVPAGAALVGAAPGRAGGLGM